MSVDLDELDRLHAAATGGEWGSPDGAYVFSDAHKKSMACVCDCGWDEECVCQARGIGDGLTIEQQAANMNCIAALHNAYPAIAKELRDARTKLAAVRNAIAECRQAMTLADTRVHRILRSTVNLTEQALEASDG